MLGVGVFLFVFVFFFVFSYLVLSGGSIESNKNKILFLLDS